MNYIEYAKSVVTDKKNNGSLYIKACERFLRDIERTDSPYYFDEKEADQLFYFIENLKQFEDRFYDKPLVLEKWQKFLLSQIFCWKEKSTGLRRFRRVYIQIARKNGKTILMSAIIMYLLAIGKSEEIYSLATRRDQSKIVYDKIAGLVKQTKLEKFYKIYRGEIKSGSNKYTYVSADHKKQDGTNPSVVIVDEYHAHQSDELVNVYTSGMGARSEPLVLIITTAGFNLDGPCYEELERGEKILDGIYKDDTYLPIIFSLNKGDDWEDERNYIKANPNLNISVSMQYLIQQKTEAQQRRSKKKDFLTKNLNIWVNGNSDWIDYEIWSKNQSEFNEDELEGRDCYGGLDLAAVSDLTAYTLYFPPVKDGEKIKVIHRCYIPEKNIDNRERYESIKFREWIDNGYITVTPGEVVDYSYLINDLIEDAKRYNLMEIGLDPYLSKNIIKPIEDELGEDILVEMRQGLKDFAPWTKDWETEVLNGNISDPNPVMSWCLSNVMIKVDQNGNYKPLKGNGHKKIDLVISSIMAMARMKHGEEKEEGSVLDVLAML